MPKVTFVIVGQSHEDSAVNKSVADTFPGLLQSLQAQKIPVHLAVESNRQRTRDDLIEFNAVSAAEEAIIREGPKNPPQAISARLQEKLVAMGVNIPNPRAYLLLNHEGTVIQEETLAKALIGQGRAAAYQQELRTLQLAKKQNIPVQALDWTMAEAAPFVKADVIDIEGAEHLRIDIMTNGALRMMEQLGQDPDGPGGMVLALNVGNAHVASFKLMLEEKIKLSAVLRGVETQVEGIATFSEGANLTAAEAPDVMRAELDRSPRFMRLSLPKPAANQPFSGKAKDIDDFAERVDDAIQAGSCTILNSAALGTKILAVGTEHVKYETKRQLTLKPPSAAASVHTSTGSSSSSNSSSSSSSSAAPKDQEKSKQISGGSAAGPVKPPPTVRTLPQQQPQTATAAMGSQQSNSATTTAVVGTAASGPTAPIPQPSATGQTLPPPQPPPSTATTVRETLGKKSAAVSTGTGPQLATGGPPSQSQSSTASNSSMATSQTSNSPATTVRSTVGGTLGGPSGSANKPASIKK